ncbi:MAG: L-rhamnose mutarotase [Lentisphaeraceae bacterium]|nr:L-rhamnose mutarotase [Lentisphaeraceae bacterium]
MKSLAYTVNLKGNCEIIQKYIDHHANVWPEVSQALKEVGILDMKIFILGRRLFMYCEVTDSFDPKVDFPRYLTLSPKCQEWEDLMTTFQEPVKDASEGEKWAQMTQIFQL